MTFEGRYFDGKTSAGYPAQVNMNSWSLEISYAGPEGQQQISWAPDKIYPNDFTGRGTVYLKYGDYPFQYLEVNQENFEREFKETYPNAKFHKSAYNAVFSTGVKGILVMAVLFIGIVLLGYFYALPAFAEYVAGSVPISWEKQFGDAAYNQMMGSETIDKDNSKRANAFFKEMGYKTDYDVEIVVTKNGIVNAFALPGGKIVVYEGILRGIDSHQEFAALLSHEFSHVELRHSTKNIFRSLSSYMLISLILGDAGGLTAVVIQNADQLKQLGYSRGLEEEADRSGLKLMKDKQIDPQGMEDLLKTLKEEEGESGIDESTAFLSSHPLTKERMKYIQQDIDKKDYSVQEHATLDSLWSEIKLNVGNEVGE